MSSPNLVPFVGQKYLNLESVKRDGTPVQTPVWFAEDHGVLYVYTLANAGKVKRIRLILISVLPLVPCAAP
jgi:PPOX class probable F420-dependent enzyme